MYPYRIESFGSGFLKDTAGNGNLRIMISSLHQRLVDHNCFPLLLEDHRTASNAGYSIYDFTQYTFEKKNIGSILITVQRDATQSSLFIILQVHSTCFGCRPLPSSGVIKTVTTASGTGHIFCAATFLQRHELGHVGGM